MYDSERGESKLILGKAAEAQTIDDGTVRTG
jgi:hypothetical protein